jgi:hypothetical protein
MPLRENMRWPFKQGTHGRQPCAADFVGNFRIFLLRDSLANIQGVDPFVAVDASPKRYAGKVSMGIEA